MEAMEALKIRGGNLEKMEAMEALEKKQENWEKMEAMDELEKKEKSDSQSCRGQRPAAKN